MSVEVATRSRRRTWALCQQYETQVQPSCQCEYSIYACCCHDPSLRIRVNSDVLRTKSRNLSQAWESQFQKEKEKIEKDKERQELHRNSKLRAESMRYSRQPEWERNNRRRRQSEMVDAKQQAEDETNEFKLKALISDMGSVAFGKMQDAFHAHYVEKIAPGVASLVDYQLVVYTVHFTLDPKLGNSLVELLLDFIPETWGEWQDFRGSVSCDLAKEYARGQFTGDRVFDAHFLKCAYDPQVGALNTEYDVNALTLSLEA